MKTEFTICIGTYFDVSKGQDVPKQTIQITQEQLEIIQHFADIKRDAELNVIYKINECEFTIKPILFRTPKETIEAFTQ